MLDAVKWCNFCNAAPADGRLEAILFEGAKPEMFDVCQKCVNDIPKENWMDKETGHEI